MIWYRGDDTGRTQHGPAWYAAEREYAEFFGAAVAAVEVDPDAVLDLRDWGLNDFEDLPEGLPAARASDCEMYMYAERQDVQDAARGMGYRGLRVMQWHAGFGGPDDAQDTLMLVC